MFSTWLVQFFTNSTYTPAQSAKCAIFSQRYMKNSSVWFCSLKRHTPYVVLLRKSATLSCSKQHYLAHTHYDWKQNIHCCWKLSTMCCYQPLLSHYYNYINLWGVCCCCFDLPTPHTCHKTCLPCFKQWNVVCEVDYTGSSFLKSSGTCSCNNSDQPYRLK